MAKKKDLKYLLGIYFRIIKNYKFLIVITLLVILFLSILNLANKFFLKYLIDKAAAFHSRALQLNQFLHFLTILAASYLIVLLLSSFLTYAKFILINKIDLGSMFDLKTDFFNHIIDLDYSFHTEHKTGGLISKLGRGTSAIERINDFLLFQATPLLFSIIIVSSTIFYFDKMSTIIILITMIVFVSFSLSFLKTIKKREEISVRAEDKEKANISDILTNISPVKFFGKEETMKSKIRKLSTDTKKKSKKAWDLYGLMDAGNHLIISVGLIFVMYFSLKRFIAGEMTTGTLMFIYSSYFSIINPLSSFVWGLQGFTKALADIKGLFDYKKIKPKIKDKPNAKEIKIKQGKIEFKNVSFAYKKQKVIKNFSLAINPGERVALVGHSGSGKSTIVKLLYRLYDPQEGEILIDGINIKDVRQKSLRAEMSMVPQECVLFDDTIYNNILFSNPKATKEEVFRAMKLAKIWDFVQSLPKKEKTIVGERGIKLSGGEKQRVSIARAILANKRILVLDEATSALDSKTEHEIQEALQNLLKNRTSLIIAHRLSTIMHSDKIVVMERGKIKEIGTHKDLIKKQGIYKELWDLQKGGYVH